MPRPARIGVLCAFLLAACGDDDTAATTTGGATTVSAVTTTTSASGTSAATTTTVEDDAVVIVVDGTYGTPQISVNGDTRTLGDRIAADIGDTIRVVVRLAATDEVHVHTYDLSVAAPEGEEVELEFVADIPGIFEVELEEAHTLLFELEVA